MAGSTLRFVHSGDWRLDRPLSGLAEVPDHLRELFVEVPYLAAERVVETALSERADFVVLCGGLLDARRTGAVGPAFLLKQCERLHERSIAVYWLTDKADRHWPRTVLLPPNVHRLEADGFVHLAHARGDDIVAHICAGGWADGLHASLSELAERTEQFTVGLARGAIDIHALRASGVRYWACGGRHKRHTLFSGRTTAHHAGSPQGHGPKETGPRGCTLIEVDSEAKMHSRFVSTDVVRWRDEQVELAADQTPGDMERLLLQRMADLAERDGDSDVIVHWTARLHQQLPHALWRHRAASLVETLRAQFGYATPVRWTAAVEVSSAAAQVPEPLRHEDTILGDFLSEVARFQLHPDECLDLSSFVSDRQAVQLAGALRLGDSKQRERVLDQVAALGYDLLGGSHLAEETQP